MKLITEEIEQVEDETLIYTAFTDFGNMQKQTIMNAEKKQIIH